MTDTLTRRINLVNFSESLCENQISLSSSIEVSFPHLLRNKIFQQLYLPRLLFFSPVNRAPAQGKPAALLFISIISQLSFRQSEMVIAHGPIQVNLRSTWLAKPYPRYSLGWIINLGDKA